MLIDKEIAVNVFGAEAEQQPEYKRLYGSSSTNAMVWKDGYVKGMLNVYNSAQQEVSAYKEELASLKEENAKLREEKKDLLNALESLSPTVKK